MAERKDYGEVRAALVHDRPTYTITELHAIKRDIRPIMAERDALLAALEAIADGADPIDTAVAALASAVGRE